MDSIFDSIKLTKGLGDCLIAGAAVQKLSLLTNRKIKYVTDPRLEFLFENHPNIEYAKSSSNPFELKWVSQYQNNLYPLHTMQRFSSQLGFYLDPTETLKFYDNNGIITNNPKNRLVCINQFSAEKSRRFIPQKYTDSAKSICENKGYEVIILGELNIANSLSFLRETSLFIGPVSFLYHLASCIGTKSLLFISYMPEHKFSHFSNTTSIIPKRKCSYLCEENETQFRNENDCWGQCKAIDYNFEDFLDKLNQLL